MLKKPAKPLALGKHPGKLPWNLGDCYSYELAVNKKGNYSALIGQQALETDKTSG